MGQIRTARAHLVHRQSAIQHPEQRPLAAALMPNLRGEGEVDESADFVAVMVCRRERTLAGLHCQV